VDSKSQFNNLIGQLSQMKQEICSLEMEAVNSYTEAVVRKSKEFAAAESHAEIPPTTFKVSSSLRFALNLFWEFNTDMKNMIGNKSQC